MKSSQPNINKEQQEYCVAFYNLENLFDTYDDPYTLDDDFTPSGFKKWKDSRYRSKIKKLAKAISKIGEDEQLSPPVLIGVAEVENKKVLKKLINTKYLKDYPYDFVHFDSPDERGIDTGLIYHKDHFEVKDAETIPLIIKNEEGERDYTRDILFVRGKLNDEQVSIFVNHWPSRRDGIKETEHKRIAAAENILNKIGQITKKSAAENFIIMGDFNDDPNSKSVQTLMDSGLFINPMKKLLSPYSGSANYKGEWTLFDQILISHSFLNHQANTHTFKKAAIFAPRFLKEWKGKYKGNPFRTFVGKKYIGGYSDHFPVYVVLKLNS